MASTSNNDKKIERKLKYKKLIEKGAKVGESLANQNVIDSLTNIMDILNNCEDISTDYARDAKVENTADYLMDAQIIKMSHDLMGSMTQKMSNNDFREDEYIASLVNLMTTNANTILDTAIDSCHNVKFQLSLLGTFDFDAQSKVLEAKKKNRPRQRKTMEPKSAPENIKSITKVDKGAEKINIVHSEIRRIFLERKAEHVPYFEIITNPQSYMKSIDTAFQVAFLIRDGHLGVVQINDVPHIFFKEASSTSQSQQHDSGETGQALMSLSPLNWKEHTKTYKLKSPLLHLDSDTDNDDI